MNASHLCAGAARTTLGYVGEGCFWGSGPSPDVPYITLPKDLDERQCGFDQESLSQKDWTIGLLVGN